MKYKEGKAMAAAKGSTVETGIRNFKVYSDNEKIKAKVSSITVRKSLIPARETSAPRNEGARLTTASDSKGGSRFAENIKGKYVRSGNQGFNIRRKALADVSNAQSSFSRNATCGDLKQLISVGPGCRTGNISSRKGSMGRIKTSLKNGGFPPTRKDDLRTNTRNFGRESIVCDSRNARDSFVSMRKSLPVLRIENQADKSNAKNNDKDSDKVKKPNVFSDKAKMNKKIEQASISRSYLQRKRVSVGSITMAPKVQTNMNAHGSYRNVIKPTGKMSINMSNVQGKQRSKCASAMNKSTSVSVISKKKDESVTSSSLNHIPLAVPPEAILEPLSYGNNNSTANKLDAIIRRRSDRRRSYTSSLMTKSKLLVEHGEVQLEKLFCIDDKCNQLEVAEYVDEIYQFYWVSEMHNLSLANYMSNQTEITPQMRGILINWLIEVHLKFELMPETLYLMVMLLDQFLSQVEIKKKEMQLVGLTTMLLASKYEDFWHPRIKDLLSISAESYTRDQMLTMEKLILKKLKFRLNAPTSYVFMLRFLKAAQSDLKLEHLAFYLIELCLVQYEALKFKPSMLCASAIYVARSTLQLVPAWSPLLAKHARYQLFEIRDCAEMILRFQKDARTSHWKVTFDKYTSPDLSSIAAIKPLNELPF